MLVNKQTLFILFQKIKSLNIHLPWLDFKFKALYYVESCYYLSVSKEVSALRNIVWIYATTI